MKITKKMRKMFNLYNIAIVVCIIVIIGSLCIILKPNKKHTSDGIEIIQTGVKETEEISEQDAKKAAIKQFKKIGEKAKLEDLKCVKIRRDQVEYYYITSAQNSLEISVIGGKIERINSVLVEE